MELNDASRRAAAEALVHVQLALSRLRAIATVPEMLDLATKELCLACGFDRALLFRLEGSTMTAASTYVRDDPDWATELLAAARRMPVALDHLVLETEMIRRRGAMLVRDPVNDPRTHKPLVNLYRTRSYVAAPIMPGGRVIGFLHGDLYWQERPVDELDRDTLWTFVEGFGYALERTILLQRLRGQRVRIEGLLNATAAIMTEVCDAERDLSETDGDQRADAAPLPPGMPTAPRPLAMRRLLTARELEVLELMAAGMTNVEIATRLVISRTTVKSHVKAILRKLRAANRAEAVARYLRAGDAERQPM